MVANSLIKLKIMEDIIEFEKNLIKNIIPIDFIESPYCDEITINNQQVNA